MTRGKNFLVWAALFGDLAVSATKFGAAAITGSSAMLSEAVHSLMDAGNEVLLFHGAERANRPPDATHPLGYGRELYFWSFIVAVSVFAVGAGVAAYEGVDHIRNRARSAGPRSSSSSWDLLPCSRARPGSSR